MANRYWVGGTAAWDGTSGTKWSATSGGAGGATRPTSADDVFFDAASGTVTCTVSGAQDCKSLNFTGFTGTFAGASPVNVFGGNVTASATMTWTHSDNLNIAGVCSFTSNGKTITSVITTSNSATVLTLADALTTNKALTITNGTFATNNYNVTAASLSSSNSNTRTINLGSSTVTLTSATGLVMSTTTGLTFNAETSSIVLSGAGATKLTVGSPQTFYNVSFTSGALTAPNINGSCTFNNLTIAGRIVAGVTVFALDADQTINGTLTFSAGTNATMRTFVRSDTIGTTRTLTCASVASLTDIDFRDITIAGAAAPVSGTRLGDCKGNSGITFDAAKTVYYTGGSTNWSANVWWNASGVSNGNLIYFPLAQDTAVFQAGIQPTGTTVTINAAYNIGTIDMSARTSNTMTLATGTQTPTIYGNWVNGTGTTISGTGNLTFAGRGSQTITSAGKTFTQSMTFDSPGGGITLLDAFNGTGSTTTHTSGSFDANDYSFTSSTKWTSSGTSTKAVNFGSSTWTFSTSGNTFAYTGSGLTVSGTGTISMTSTSSKTFAGGNIQTYPTINQGGAGTLTITGSNKFANITNTAIGRVQFTGGTTNEFTSFNLNGTSGNLLQLGSTNTTQVTLKAPSWNVGANSTDGGNNTGLSFTAGSVDYLNVSYVNGVVVAGSTSQIYYGSTNVTTLKYGSATVTAVYYGSTQVF